MRLAAPQPRYRQVAQTLINEIQNGQYPVGSLITTEAELCEQFGISRFTVREAIKQLVEMGLVSRQAGVGTRVLDIHTRATYRQVMQGLADLQQYTAETELEILGSEMIQAQGDLCEMLGASPGQSWLKLYGIRSIAGAHAPPICITEIYLHPMFRSLRDLGGRASVPVYVRLEEQFGEKITEVRQQIRAVALSEDLAAQLSAEPGAPALWVCRSYLNKRGDIVEVAISTHPGDRFDYSATFRREWRAGSE